MKAIHTIVNWKGQEVVPDPYDEVTVELVSVTYLPGCGDPEDPNDGPTLEFKYKLLEG